MVRISIWGLYLSEIVISEPKKSVFKKQSFIHLFFFTQGNIVKHENWYFLCLASDIGSLTLSLPWRRPFQIQYIRSVLFVRFSQWYAIFSTFSNSLSSSETLCFYLTYYYLMVSLLPFLYLGEASQKFLRKFKPWWHLLQYLSYHFETGNDFQINYIWKYLWQFSTIYLLLDNQKASKIYKT